MLQAGYRKFPQLELYCSIRIKPLDVVIGGVMVMPAMVHLSKGTKGSMPTSLKG